MSNLFCKMETSKKLRVKCIHLLLNILDVMSWSICWSEVLEKKISEVKNYESDLVYKRKSRVYVDYYWNCVGVGLYIGWIYKSIVLSQGNQAINTSVCYLI